MLVAAILGLWMATQEMDPSGEWARFARLVEDAVPRTGRVQLLYEVTDPPSTFAKEMVGLDFENGGAIRVHDGDALGVSSAGRQFSGSLSTGCVWMDPPAAYPPAMLHPSALSPAPYEVLRFVLERPDLVENLRPSKDGGYVLDMVVIGGVPGATEQDLMAGAVVRREEWSLVVGPDGRVRKKIAPTTIEYEYGQDPWPTAYRMTHPSTATTRWDLTSDDQLAPDALTPAGAMAILSSFETRKIRDTTDESQAAQGIGAVRDGYERDPGRRWSFALVAGGILIFILGGGVLIRKRYGGA